MWLVMWMMLTTNAANFRPHRTMRLVTVRTAISATTRPDAVSSATWRSRSFHLICKNSLKYWSTVEPLVIRISWSYKSTNWSKEHFCLMKLQFMRITSGHKSLKLWLKLYNEYLFIFFPLWSLWDLIETALHSVSLS